MSVLDVLECGLQLIDTKDKWCKIDAIQDKDGNSLKPIYGSVFEAFKQLDSIDGCKYCSYAALSVAGILLKTSRYTTEEAEEYLMSAAKELYPEMDTYIYVNDDPETTYDDIINLWTLAIQNCKDKSK